MSVCLFGFIERSHCLANIVGVTPPSQSQTTLPCEHVSNGPWHTGVSLGPWGPPINGLWFYLPPSLSLWAWTIVVAACHEKLHCDWLFYLSSVKLRLLLLLLLLLDIYFQVTATCVAFIAALIVYFFLISFCLIIYCLFIFVL